MKSASFIWIPALTLFCYSASVMGAQSDENLITPEFAAVLRAGDPARLRALLVARGYAPGDLVPALRDRLMALLLLHRHSDLDIQLRIPDWRGRAHSLDQLAALVFPLPCDRTGDV